MVAFYFENKQEAKRNETVWLPFLIGETNKKILKPNSDIHNNFLI